MRVKVRVKDRWRQTRTLDTAKRFAICLMSRCDPFLLQSYFRFGHNCLLRNVGFTGAGFFRLHVETVVSTFIVVAPSVCEPDLNKLRICRFFYPVQVGVRFLGPSLT